MAVANSLETLLRRALNHLYDATFLRDSPLISLLRLDTRGNPAATLRNCIENAIEALGQDRYPTTSLKNRRYHEILFYRYVQQFTQTQVAHQLGVSPRHLRREQNAAICALAEYLRERHRLSVDDQLKPTTIDADTAATTTNAAVDKEIMWLEDSLSNGLADVNSVLQESLQTAQALAEAHRVHLGIGANAALPSAAIAPTVLKQIVLNLITTLISVVPGGTISLTAKAVQDRVVIDLTANVPHSGAKMDLTQDQAKIDMSRRLAKLFIGEVTIGQEADMLTFSVSIPSTEQIRALAIEDNEDTLQLWKRYVEQTRFHLMGIREPLYALEAAIEQKPDLIILDVMLPGIDGWELLSQLRHHPLTSHIPIIVCTVLPQRELAFSLGASDFICKPVTRQSFLDALRRQSEALKPK